MLSKKQILKLFEKLNQKLSDHEVKGEIYLLGGAVMCLASNARASTKDLDAVFSPKSKIRELALEIAREEKLPQDWLTDSVKEFLSENASFETYLNLSNLSILVASAEYILAMKCLSMRIGLEFHDEQDVRYLLRYLNIDSCKEALLTIERYYPLEQLPQKSFYALEEILGK
ncbi:MAG: hypothetical protein KDD42_06060 [Bdellovibrionales bacterium]|nr:hypothetical protein [Bdellovibrionales bacterium]